MFLYSLLLFLFLVLLFFGGLILVNDLLVIYGLENGLPVGF